MIQDTALIPVAFETSLDGSHLVSCLGLVCVRGLSRVPVLRVGLRLSWFTPCHLLQAAAHSE